MQHILRIIRISSKKGFKLLKEKAPYLIQTSVGNDNKLEKIFFNKKFMKKIINFLNKYKNIILIFSAVILIILLFTYIGFTQENFSLYIKIYLLSFLIYKLVFKIEQVEKFIISKITYILLLGIFFIMYFQKDLGITNKDILLMSGGIIAFWYGYKKYERDKELEIIEKYTKKYNIIKLKEVGNFNEENCKLFFDLWYEEFYLKSKGYISDELWNEWMGWIYIDILKIIKIDSSIFINIMAEFYQYNDKTNIKYNDKNYLLFIQNIIKKILENSKKGIKTLKEDTFDSILLTEKEKYIKEKYIKEKYIIEYDEVIVFCEKSLKHMKNFYKVTN